MAQLKIRNARPEDAPLILDFITKLAIYERAEHEVVATQESIKSTMFSSEANAKALICSLDDQPIGFAVYFFNYSIYFFSSFR